MANPDPFLRPGLTPSTDVELYASEAAGGTTTPVAVATTAVGTAAETHEFISGAGSTTNITVSAVAVGAASEAHIVIPGTPTPPPSDRRYYRPIPLPIDRAPLVRRVAVGTQAQAQVGITMRVYRAGRQRREDELLLVGAF